MNKKFKFLTMLLALVMTLGVFAPFSARAEEEAKETETLTVHKVLLQKDALEKHDANKEYDGETIKNIQDFFGDTTAEEIEGVYFKLQKPIENSTLKVDDDTQWEDIEGKEGLTKKDTETNVIGLKIDTKGLKGTYRLVEVHEKSTYKGKDGETLTGSKAVPTLITLPLVNEKGIVKEAHVYPKNTQEKPKIDKNFDENSGLKKGEKNDTPVTEGANYDNYEMEKDTANARVGLEVKYQVKTEIPAKSHLQEAHWDDRMTEGLTYKTGSLKITVDGTLLDAADYSLDEREDGFDLRLTESGLKKVNEKDKAVTVELKYSAIVNAKAKVDIPDSNDVTFHYGHKKGEGNTPVPTNPKDGKIKVEKSWAEGVTDADKIELSVQLYNANTGKKVGEVQKLNQANNWSYEWTGLDEKYQYKVVEIYSGFEAEYSVGEVGTIKIKNHKSDNPKPLNPTEPKVVTGGKKFVKTNQDQTERLAGAEFYVKNKAGQYLVIKTKDDSAKEAAKKALDEAIKAYNNLTAEEQKDEAKVTAAKNLINEKQAAYNEAFIEAAKNYTWEDGTTNAIVLTSNAKGQFEIKGLEYGTYYLEEIKAPEGYAKLSGPVEFVVEEGSYTTKGCDIKYEQDQKEADDAKCVANKKVSIPQTGGIGTVIFTVVGVMLMVGAAFALKRRKEDELEGLA